jgi:CBS-domain-containing membrane protein
MKVRDVMTAVGLTVTRPDDDLALAGQMMLWANVRHLPVVRDGAVVGVVSQHDLMRSSAARDPAWPRLTVEEVMSAPAVTIDPDVPIPTAVSMMLSRKVGCLPVVTDGLLVGIVTTTDLLRHQLDTGIESPADKLPPIVRTLMKPAFAVLTPDSPIFDAAAMMGARGVRHLPVVDAEQRVVGILSDRDVRTALGDPRRFLDDPRARDGVQGRAVREFMSSRVVTVGPNMSAAVAIERLLADQVGALPVVADDGKLIGMLSYVDVIQALKDAL